MPRVRQIKPQFWIDENLGKIPRDARLLYIGLWNLADDNGVFEWRPQRIKVQLFPYDEDVTETTINKCLQLLISSGDVEKFKEDGKPFGFIKSFQEHQQIVNPSKWTFANPPDNPVCPYPCPANPLPETVANLPALKELLTAPDFKPYFSNYHNPHIVLGWDYEWNIPKMKRWNPDPAEDAARIAGLIMSLAGKKEENTDV